MTDTKFTAAEYEAALAHELCRLHDAAADAGLRPRGLPYVRWIAVARDDVVGWYAVTQSTRAKTRPDGNGAVGQIDITGTGKTIGQALEDAHRRLRSVVRNWEGA